MRNKSLTPQPFTMEGFLNWAKECGHYPLIGFYANFLKFSQNCTKIKEEIPPKK